MAAAERRCRERVSAPSRTISRSFSITRKTPDASTSTTIMWIELLPRSMAAMRIADPRGRGAGPMVRSRRAAGTAGASFTPAVYGRRASRGMTSP
jgi:hypothetical protein